nr:hypothetical protein [Tanacetum cinerariifolium]
ALGQFHHAVAAGDQLAQVGVDLLAEQRDVAHPLRRQQFAVVERGLDLLEGAGDVVGQVPGDQRQRDDHQQRQAQRHAGWRRRGRSCVLGQGAVVGPCGADQSDRCAGWRPVRIITDECRGR